VKQILGQEKCRVGLNFVHGELIGWLWFAIGVSHVSGRLPFLHTSKRHPRRDPARGRGSYFD